MRRSSSGVTSTSSRAAAQAPPAAEAVGERVVAWISGARETLDLALYDVRLPGAVGDAVGGISAEIVRDRVHDRDAERAAESGKDALRDGTRVPGNHIRSSEPAGTDSGKRAAQDAPCHVRGGKRKSRRIV